MRMERPEAEILHRKRGKKREREAKMIEKPETETETENGERTEP